MDFDGCSSSIDVQNLTSGLQSSVSRRPLCISDTWAQLQGVHEEGWPLLQESVQHEKAQRKGLCAHSREQAEEVSTLAKSQSLGRPGRQKRLVLTPHATRSRWPLVTSVLMSWWCKSIGTSGYQLERVQPINDNFSFLSELLSAAQIKDNASPWVLTSLTPCYIVGCRFCFSETD